MWGKALAVVGLSVVALASTAQAQELPRFDVEGYCEEIAEFGGGSHSIYNGCIDMEQQSYNRLKDDWPTLSARIRNYCTEIGTFGGESYSTMQGCVDMETQAASGQRGFSFD